MKKNDYSENYTIKRIGGHLHKIVPVLDKTGEVLHHAVHPFQVEFKFRDLFQVMVGASILAVPVAFTEEVWGLSAELHLKNILILAMFSLFIIAVYSYYNIYHTHLRNHYFEFIKRVFLTYAVALFVVAVFLTIIQRCPWGTDNILAIKRIILIAFPASMSGVLSDSMK